MTIRGDNADVKLSDYQSTINLYRTWQYSSTGWQYAWTPYNLAMYSAKVSIKALNGKPGEVSGLSGDLDITLNWNNENANQLPSVRQLTGSTEFYRWNEEVGYFNGSISYSNSDYSSQTSDIVRWAKNHTNNFSLQLSTEASIKVPTPGVPDYLSYQSVKLAIGLSHSSYSWYTDRKWIAMEYGGTGYRIERTSKPSPVFTITNQVGDLVTLLVSEDQSKVHGGQIIVDGERIANMSGGFGNSIIIRYPDGTIESL